MKIIEIRNVSRGNVIAGKGRVAEGFFARLKGQIGRERLDEDEGLCIKPCKGIHTFFMKFDIDVVFVDRNGLVCGIVENIRPSRVSQYISSASYVIELSRGMCKKKGIEIGNKIELHPLETP